MTTDVRRQLGDHGEDLAVEALEQAGLTVLDRNWRCRWGELDVVAEDGPTLVFCEVKTRRGLGYGSPVEAVTHAKLRRLRRLAAEWLTSHEQHADRIRIDVVGVLIVPGAAPSVTHLRGVG